MQGHRVEKVSQMVEDQRERRLGNKAGILVGQREIRLPIAEHSSQIDRKSVSL